MELADESTSNMQEDEQSSKSDDDMADLEELDISSCVMCDLKHDTIEDMQLAVNLRLPGAENLVSSTTSMIDMDASKTFLAAVFVVFYLSFELYQF